MIRLFQRKLKYLKNPKLLIPAIIYKFAACKYKYTHLRTYKDMLKLTQNCEGLISLIEATYLYKTAIKNRRILGCILDFGSYKGLSTCILSRVAAKTKRNVIAFESFQDLPFPSGEEKNFVKKENIKVLKLNLSKI